MKDSDNKDKKNKKQKPPSEAAKGGQHPQLSRRASLTRRDAFYATADDTYRYR